MTYKRKQFDAARIQAAIEESRENKKLIAVIEYGWKVSLIIITALASVGLALAVGCGPVQPPCSSDMATRCNNNDVEICADEEWQSLESCDMIYYHGEHVMEQCEMVRGEAQCGLGR